MKQVLIDCAPAVLRITSSKHFEEKAVPGSTFLQMQDTGKLRFTVSVITPGFGEDHVFFPPQSLNFFLTPELAGQVVKALSQPTVKRPVRVLEHAIQVLELSKPNIPGATIELADEFRKTLIQILKEEMERE